MNRPGSQNQDFRILSSLWPDLTGARVLDLGCGSGLYTRELVRRGAVVVGVDSNLDSLRAALLENGRGCVICADAVHLPFRPGVFDLTLSVEVLTHIPPQSRTVVFGSVAQVLKDKGRFYCTLHNRQRLTLASWSRWRRAREVYHTHRLSVWPMGPAQARAELAGGGMHSSGGTRYLNFHSRFSYEFFVAHPTLARLVMVVEDVLSRTPFLRRLGITFLAVGVKGVHKGRSETDESR